jgi:hypothetical protein
LPDRFAAYFEIADKSLGKTIDFVLSYEFLSDLSGMKQYQMFLDDYVSALTKRFAQPDPQDCYCKSGNAINLKIRWPITPMPDRDASVVHVTVHDLKLTTALARCSVIFIYPIEDTLRFNPFARYAAIVNRIRLAVDRQEVLFYTRAGHPEANQQLSISQYPEESSYSSDMELTQFVSGKVFWLGFKRQDKAAKVWIADPWDGEYLGTDTKTLRQIAQLQVARRVLSMGTDDLASPGDALLVRESLPKPDPRRNVIYFSGGGPVAKKIEQMLRELLPSATILNADDARASGVSFRNDLRSAVERSDHSIFDVGDNNPNTLFELGYVQALKKDVVLLVPREAAGSLPVNLAAFLYLPYERDKLSELRLSLSNYIERHWGLPVNR